MRACQTDKIVAIVIFSKFNPCVIECSRLLELMNLTWTPGNLIIWLVEANLVLINYTAR